MANILANILEKGLFWELYWKKSSILHFSSALSGHAKPAKPGKPPTKHQKVAEEKSKAANLSVCPCHLPVIVRTHIMHSDNIIIRSIPSLHALFRSHRGGGI